MTRSARSARSTDLLARHPEALIKGRPEGRSNEEARCRSRLDALRGARRVLVAQPGALHDRAGARRGAERRTQGRRICSRSAIARFLERSQIVRSSENYRLDVMSNDWWGEPLGAMVSRVLVEELGQRLPQSTVIGESGAVSASARRDDRAQLAAARRGRVRQPHPAGSGKRQLQGRAARRYCAASASP